MRVSALASLIVFAATTTPGSAAHACAYDSLGVLSFAGLDVEYSEIIEVRHAIWRAQVDRIVPVEQVASSPSPVSAFAAPIAAAQTGNPTQTIQAWEAFRVITAWRGKMAEVASLENHPPLALVFIDSMLWTRVVPTDTGLVTQMHAPGPERRDTVVVTDLPVLQGLIDGQMSVTEGFELGVIRTYGSPEATEKVRRWLIAAFSG